MSNRLIFCRLWIAIAMHISLPLTDDVLLSILMMVSSSIKAARDHHHHYQLSTHVSLKCQRLSADFNEYHLTPQLPLRKQLSSGERTG